MAVGGFTFNVNEKNFDKLNRVYKKMGDLAEVPEVKRALKTAVDKLVDKAKGDLLSKLMGHGKMVNGHYTPNTMNLYRSFTTEIRKTQLRAYAGFRRPEGNHAHLVDAGTKERYTLRPYTDRRGRYYPAGQYRGKMPANNFWSSMVQSILPSERDNIINVIDMALKKIHS